MKTEILVINKKELILFKCIPRQQALDNVLSIFLGGRKGGKPKFEGKGESFEKLGEKDKTLTPRKSHLQTAWFGRTYGICL